MKTYTEKELVDFGNYLLSDERMQNICEENKKEVHDADIANFNGLTTPIFYNCNHDIEIPSEGFHLGISPVGDLTKFEIIDTFEVVGKFWDMALNLKK